MKKLISYLITIMMVFTMMPYTAFAGSDHESPESNTLEQTAEESISIYIQQYNPLYSDEERIVEVVDDDIAMFSESAETQSAAEPVATIEEAAAILRAGMVDRQEEVVVNIQITADELTQEAMDVKTSAIFNAALQHTGVPNEGDYLKWVYESVEILITAEFDGSDYYAAFTFLPAYYTTAEQEAALTSAVEILKSELALDGKTDYEKVKAIYDYMTANITYDYEHYGDDTYKPQFTAYAALVNKTSVCQGYATLLYRMALEYGIDIRVISGMSINNQGNSEGHSWNIVKLGDKYYNLDATWDATWDSDKTTHDYFLRGSDNFTNHTSSEDYTKDEFTAAYPVDTADYVVGNETEEPEIPNECIHAETEVIPAVAATCTERGNIEYYKCTECKNAFRDETGQLQITEEETVIAALGHDWDTILTVDREPTCAESGYESYHCIRCSDTTYVEIPATGVHKWTAWEIFRAPTCIDKGAATSYCEVCCKGQYKELPATGKHRWSKWLVYAASKWYSGERCRYCFDCYNEQVEEIYRIKSMYLSAKKFVYNGKVRKPVVTVKDTKSKKLVKGTDYSVKFKNQQGKAVTAPKAVGKYTAVVTFKGNYSGTVSETFTINPKATAINKLTKPGKKQIKVTWQKRTVQVTGYEIQYSTTKNFTKKTTKTLKVKNCKTNTKTIKQLNAKKKYWVKVRTYKSVNGKLYYSAWSKVKTVTTK